MDKVTKSVTRRKPPEKGGSRKGIPNKVTKEVKEMILAALDKVGGEDYLAEKAADPRTASAFLGLVGKVLPLQLTGAGGGAIEVNVSAIELLKSRVDRIAGQKRAG
mgnify:CR=1 FL=1